MSATADMIEAFIVDVNGVPRGKLLPGAVAEKIRQDGLRLPRSSFAFDIWGQDVPAAGMVNETGDPDGICFPVNDDFQPIPWAPKYSKQVLLRMLDPDGSPVFADPRHVLSRVIATYAKHGLTPVVACELEFYLIDAGRSNHGGPMPPRSPIDDRHHYMPQTYSLQELNDYSDFLGKLMECCELQGIPAQTITSENGPCQFEVNLQHVPDAIAAADHALLLKRAAKGTARQCGFDATFMAMPFGQEAGNGMHVHFSVIDDDGHNLMADQTSRPSPAMLHMIGGLLRSLPDSMAIFAPNANSYRRLRSGIHAPSDASWGHDNRYVALRVPNCEPAAMRIEHRVCGADVNPYLALAAMLAAAFDGYSRKIVPTDPTPGDTMSNTGQLPKHWNFALDRFDSSDFVARYFDERYRRLYSACKRQELAGFEAVVSQLEYDSYLSTV